MSKFFMNCHDVERITKNNKDGSLIGLTVGHAVPEYCFGYINHEKPEWSIPARLNGALGYCVAEKEIGTVNDCPLYELDIAYAVELTGFYTVQRSMKVIVIKGIPFRNEIVKAWVCDPDDLEAITKIINNGEINNNPGSNTIQ